jgi:hypothetical protein
MDLVRIRDISVYDHVPSLHGLALVHLEWRHSYQQPVDKYGRMGESSIASSNSISIHVKRKNERTSKVLNDE